MTEQSKKSPESKTTVNLAGICKSFSDKPILEDISFSLSNGQALCICGPNASGKTTLLTIIAGLLPPDKGKVEICGFNVRSQNQKIKPHLGTIFHKSMVYSQLTIQENLDFFARLYRIENKKECLDELLEQTHLTQYRFGKAAILSRGILQKLSIARALIHNPTVLLADEPFAGLDLQAAEHIAEILYRLKNNGKTLIMTSHNLNFALKCCEQAAVLNEHRLKFHKDISKIDTAEFAGDYISSTLRKNH